MRACVLLAGLILGQVMLYAPSLAGRKILLPLDLLAAPDIYLPRDVAAQVRIHDPLLFDLVLQTEINRRFAVSEVRAGRLPLWNPLNYCGAPFLAANQPAVFSVFRLLDYAWPGPIAIAWGQLLRSVAAGIGAYLFFRQSLRVDFAPSTVGAWCYALGGTQILAAGYSHSATALWLAWALWAVDRAARRPDGVAIARVALVTAAMLLSGHLATALQVLLAAGAYFVWRLIDQYGWRIRLGGGAAAALITGAAGVLLGLALSAPQTLPTLEYLQSSARVLRRAGGAVETPAQGSSALSQLVLPYVLGSNRTGSTYIGEPRDASGIAISNRIESEAGGYTGFFVALVLAPLGWCSRSHRRQYLFWLIAGALALCPTLGVPILSDLLSIGPLKVLRNNRLVVVSGFALLVMGVIGLQALSEGIRPPRWLLAASLLPATLGAWCVQRAGETPVVNNRAVGAAGASWSIPDLLWPARWSSATGFNVQGWFGLMYRNGAVLCGAAVLIWLLIGLRRSPFRRRQDPAAAAIARRQAWPVWALGALCVAEMIAAAFDVNPQSDPALYYPRLAALEAVAQAPPGRICGMSCLPPNLNQTHGLSDIRGYDAADPARLVELLELFRDPNAATSPDWAMTQWFVPQRSPLMNLLNLRYLIVRGSPPAGETPAIVATDYWVLENKQCLPRATVPQRVQVVNDDEQRLRLLAYPGFDARQVAYVEGAEGSLPAGAGSAEIVDELPGRVRVKFDMQRSGLLVLADLWDVGWRARVNGKRLAVYRADHALRGVVVPAGSGVVEFSYEPGSFRWGLALAFIAAVSIGALLRWKGVAPTAVEPRSEKKAARGAAPRQGRSAWR